MSDVEMLEIIPIPALEDNYIWLLVQQGHAVVVDPGDAAPVLSALTQGNYALDAILVTHHHGDHTNGIAALLEHSPSAQVYSPHNPRFSFDYQTVNTDTSLSFFGESLKFLVLTVPGHTLDHVAYVGESKFDAKKQLFCGDTLFGAGCGRLFEGTPAQMFHSLQQLAQLPVDTAIYCAHEYTAHNLRFALSLQPTHVSLLARQTATTVLRAQGLPSLPSSLALELATNPFLRCHEPGLQDVTKMQEPLEVFTQLRQMRNSF